MLFRHYQLYRLTQPLALEQLALEQALSQKLARPCANQELTTFGFISPYETTADERTDASPALTMWSEQCVMIAARMEEKILPGSAVRAEVDSRVRKIEADELRKVYKKEKDQIKDQVTIEFLPRAFTRRSVTRAYVDLNAGLVVVDSATAKSAENILSLLREAIGSLPVRPVSVKMAPTATMTDWLKEKQAAPDFFVLSNCTLMDVCEDGGTVSCKNKDLTSEEVGLHLAAGMVVTKLDLAYQDKLSFSISDKLAITKVRFEDVLQDQASQNGGDEARSQLEASFTMMVLTDRVFFPALLEAFGGEEIPQGI
ncbi:TPA: recombination-associated protein RdgC [Pseudomonas aeruginosa]|uniref:recombination-associated protein RdgC n=1 Tax=Pseudomonadaceae TaxID=135621 RepID=UPI001044BAD4|nr:MULTISPECIES: recombination-associated protein RdgC [Pseudomonas aeruginosa group]BDC78571.1 recombination-associated protein RdgC [Pseudomonas alcaligenes]HBO6962609.1 recombination-associated protein RdgC [Pseudomonas aeruginosa]HBO7218274.1 recombination-associated protein RdgC [Pseudomonas aeruginosa]